MTASAFTVTNSMGRNVLVKSSPLWMSSTSTETGSGKDTPLSQILEGGMEYQKAKSSDRVSNVVSSIAGKSGLALVYEDDTPLGIFTRKEYSQYKKEFMLTSPVKPYLTPIDDVVCVSTTDTANTGICLMEEKGAEYVIVADNVDANYRLNANSVIQGVVSINDLKGALAKGERASCDVFKKKAEEEEAAAKKSAEEPAPSKKVVEVVRAAASAPNTDFANEIDSRTQKPTGRSFLPQETIERAKKGSPIEKVKLAKDGTAAFVDVYEFAAKIRAGETDWDEIEKADLETRLKWVGMVHRGKRTPGQFMMRLRVPNGIVNADQMRFYADCVENRSKGVVDITTRANIQLRGVKLEDGPDVIDGLHSRNQTSFHSALDNVRNMVGSPLAGIDDQELVDTRPLCNALNDLISLDPVTNTRGNPYWGNLPRKFNIAVSGSRDDFAHTNINDIGLDPCKHATTGEMGFNVMLGGYMSIKRVAASIPGNMWIPADRTSVVTLCEAIIRIFRDEGERKDRQKARLMWLVEKYGVEDFKKAVIKEVDSYDRGVTIQDAQPHDHSPFERRETMGVHKQPQEGLSRVGILVPAGRLSAEECRQIADLADNYSAGEIRLTVEQNIILPNVKDTDVKSLLAEPALNNGRLKVNPGFIEGNFVSCTGAEFCGLALIETKSHAESVAKKLEGLVDVDRPIRIHWTGCPNSCGQVQVADIGIMGGPAKKLDPETGKMKAVPGCKIFVGGTIGEGAELQLEHQEQGIPLAEEELVPVLVDILKTNFGATDKKKGKRAAIKSFVTRVFS
eukprot:CAMPEP_0195537444 /NCGR_PEP_ID=MMETSP0794_2-20130614/47935_1 /TAXON_ID=515487 /ORGANISM="Stephanopyxis turris, Strain CCMP 815" /LENGTH=792 /DNA_ID=CAMNT_0040671157 /DNA_START=88 /DNA_END=2466 /DNA_ORIENTATION=-